MTDEEFAQLLHAAIDEALNARFFAKALVQYLCEKKIIKQKEDDVLTMLDAWAKDLRREAELEITIDDRAEELREQWSKIPKQ